MNEFFDFGDPKSDFVEIKVNYQDDDDGAAAAGNSSISQYPPLDVFMGLAPLAKPAAPTAATTTNTPPAADPVPVTNTTAGGNAHHHQRPSPSLRQGRRQNRQPTIEELLEFNEALARGEGLTYEEGLEEIEKFYD